MKIKYRSAACTCRDKIRAAKAHGEMQLAGDIKCNERLLWQYLSSCCRTTEVLVWYLGTGRALSR